MSTPSRSTGTPRHLSIVLAIAITFAGHASFAQIQPNEIPASSLERSVPEEKGFFQNLMAAAKFYWGSRWRSRTVGERDPDISSDFAYLEERRLQTSAGKMASFFDPEFQTRIYYSVTAKPNEQGKVPVVDPQSRALFIYFHGSGTENGSGANFNYKGNRLSVLGYSSLAFDYPFHADGPIDSRFASPERYMKYVASIIDKYRVAGQPVYLVGHSFGVNVISEFISRYPTKVDGVVLLSPAGFTKTLNRWAVEKTREMLKNFPHFVFNEIGSRWAGYISRKFSWQYRGAKQAFQDPTIVNPDLRVRIVSGENEEFIPGPLDENGMPTKDPRSYKVLNVMGEIFKKSTLVLEPNVGHLLHSYTDSEGRDLVLRELLAVDNQDVRRSTDMAQEYQRIRTASLNENDQAIQKTLFDPIFKNWLAKTYGENYLVSLRGRDTSEVTSLTRRVISDYKKFEDWRQRMIIEHAAKLGGSFYEANQAAITAALGGGRGSNREQILGAYFKYLSANPEAKAQSIESGDLITRWVTESQWQLQEELPVRKGPPEKKGANKTSAPNPSQPVRCEAVY